MENKRCVQHKEYSAEVKREILRRHYEDGETSNALAREFNISRSTVKNWFAKTNKGIDILIDRRPQTIVKFLDLYQVIIEKKFQIMGKITICLLLKNL